MIVVKIGGGAQINLEGIGDDLARLDEPVVVVHGANALRDDLAQRLGVSTRVLTSVSGFDSVLSDRAVIDLLMMAYAGVRNKRLVELCLRRGLRAVGLTGLDGALVRGRRNDGIRYREGGKTMVAHDYSGKPREVNAALLQLLLSEGYLPIVTVPIADETGTAINSENDDIVALLSGALRAQRVVHLIEASGILARPEQPESMLPRLVKSELPALEGRVTGRMRRKIRALIRLFEQSPMTVHVADGRAPAPIRDALNGAGTVITEG